jgi:uncharacterized protein
VAAVVKLLAEGATVPFIARYRKERTGGLDEVQIRQIQEENQRLQELEARRATVLTTIEGQGKLTPALKAQIEACTTLADLEDLYLPYKPKRRTRATMARERGLEPLADRICGRSPEGGKPEAEAQAFVDLAKEVPDTFGGAGGGPGHLRRAHRRGRPGCASSCASRSQGGVLVVQKEKEHEDKVTKFDTYASFEEKVATIPSHRFLAIRRGEAEGVLRASLDLSKEAPGPGGHPEGGAGEAAARPGPTSCRRPSPTRTSGCSCPASRAICASI